MAKFGAKLKINTFWNNLRLESSLTYSDLEELLSDVDVKAGNLPHYFTGRMIPKDNVIKELCNIFEISFEKGKKEFLNDHLKFSKEKSTRNKKTKVVKTMEVDPNGTTSNYIGIDDSPEEVKNSTEITIPKSTILEILYGKVSYDVFFKFLECAANKSTDSLKEIYGLVSFEDYEKIRYIIKEQKYPDSNETFYQYPNEIPVFNKYGEVIGLKKRCKE